MYCECVKHFSEWKDCPDHPDTECAVLVCTTCDTEYPDCKD